MTAPLPNGSAVPVFAEEIVPPSAEAVAQERESAPAPATSPAAPTTGPSADIRMVLAERLLSRPPESLEEADEALSRAGFVLPQSRKP